MRHRVSLGVLGCPGGILGCPGVIRPTRTCLYLAYGPVQAKVLFDM